MKINNYTFKYYFAVLSGIFLFAITSQYFFIEYASAAEKYYKYTKTHVFTGPQGLSIPDTIETDSDGSAYVAGIMAGAVDFNNADGRKDYTGKILDGVSTGIFYPYLVKYDSEDNFKWVKMIATDSQSEVHNLLVNNNHIYLSGSVAGVVDFDTRTSSTDFRNLGTGSHFTTIYDLDGNYLDTWEGVGGKMAADKSGNLYFTGDFNESIDFDNSDREDVYSAQGLQRRGYLTRYNRDGSYGWTRVFGSADITEQGQFSKGLSNVNLSLNDVLVDNSGNVYVTGAMTELSIIDKKGTTVIESFTSEAYSTSGFVSKYDTEGAYQWTKVFDVAKGFGEGTALALDKDNNLVLLMRVSDNTNIATLTGNKQVEIPKASWGSAVIKMRSDGEVFWVNDIALSRLLSSASTAPYEHLTGTDISIDPTDGSIHVSGSFTGVSYLGDDSKKREFESGYGKDMAFLSIFNPENGSFAGALTFEKVNDSFVRGISLTIGTEGSLLYTGEFGFAGGVIDFDSGDAVDAKTSTTLRSSYYTRIKLFEDEIVSPVIKNVNSDGNEHVAMKARIQELLELIEALKAKQSQLLAKEKKEHMPPGTIIRVFARNLGPGDKGDDVTQLQQYLAQDKNIYPEGEVTGFYGRLTIKAVERFQCEQDIICYGDSSSTGYGNVGPVTLTRLNLLMNQ